MYPRVNPGPPWAFSLGSIPQYTLSNTGGRTRTDMVIRPENFKSSAYTNSATPASVNSRIPRRLQLN